MLEKLTPALYRLGYPALRLAAGLNGVSLGVRAIVRDASGGVLLVRHTYRQGWHLPGGGVERGETLVEAVVRELREEAGVLAQSRPRLQGVFLRRAWPAGDQVALFEVERWRRGAALDNGEIAEISFFPLDRLPEQMDPATKAKLAEYDAGALSDRW
jgi:ADP-ribose pyrophosphatase YjhB (NUDIX family)